LKAIFKNTKKKTKRGVKRSNYKHLRTGESRFKKITKKFAFHLKPRSFLRKKTIVFILLIPILLISLTIFIPKIKSASIFKINEIEVIGNEEIKTEELEMELAGLKNKSMFDINEEEIKLNLTKKFDFVLDVHTREILPQKLVVEIEEKYPVGALLTEKGLFLIDADFGLLRSLGNSELFLQEYEKMLIAGLSDINGIYVKEKYSNIKQEDKKEWSKLTDEEKRSVLDGMISETQSKIASYTNNYLEILANSKFKNLPIIISLQDGEEISKDKERLSFSLEIFKQIQEKNLKMINITWVSKYKLSVLIDQNREIWLTQKRDLDKQMKDLSAIIWNNQLSGNRIFDLRTTSYSIKDK
jgi:hypothetical protein